MVELKQINLWGDEFIIPQARDKNIAKKAKSQKALSDEDYEKRLKSKKVTLEEKLRIIYENVYRILGHYKDEIEVIKDRDTLHNYINRAIENGIIAFDTETNNSLDTVTCKLMGPCLYTPSLKAAYVPINHIDINTYERLDWQLTEQDVRDELGRLRDNNVRFVMHNGKFDYEVIYTSCHIEIPMWWDTYISARMLDENERSAGLKQQYIDKINPDQEKYNIEQLFKNVLYAQVDPEVFALYAAPDAKMTYQLYEWQKAKWESDPSLSRMYKLFLDVDVPISKLIAKMELTGVCVDFDYAARLSNKYHNKLDDCDKTINDELSKLSSTISKWRLTPEANKIASASNSKSAKSASMRLADPVNLNSPTQLAILLYDVLQLPAVDKEAPRGTGEDILKNLMQVESPVADARPLLEALLQYRTLSKLTNTFVDKMPAAVNKFDNRVHAEFFNVATNTHRFSSKNPNLQNLPSSVKDVRLIFCGTPHASVDVEADKYIEMGFYDTVPTSSGDKIGSEIQPGDQVVDEANVLHKVQTVEYLTNYVRIVLED